MTIFWNHLGRSSSLCVFGPGSCWATGKEHGQDVDKLGFTHRLPSSSLLWFIFYLESYKLNPKKELLSGLWVAFRVEGSRAFRLGFRFDIQVSWGVDLGGGLFVTCPLLQLCAMTRTSTGKPPQGPLQEGRLW